MEKWVPDGAVFERRRSAGAEVAKGIVSLIRIYRPTVFFRLSSPALPDAMPDQINGGTHLVRTWTVPPSALSGAFICLLPFERPATVLKREEEEEEDQSAVRFVLVPASMASILTVASRRRRCGEGH